MRMLENNNEESKKLYMLFCQVEIPLVTQSFKSNQVRNKHSKSGRTIYV